MVAVSPQMRLVEDNVSSLSLLDIYKLRCAKRQLEPDTPVTRYYERLASVQVGHVFQISSFYQRWAVHYQVSFKTKYCLNERGI